MLNREAPKHKDSTDPDPDSHTILSKTLPSSNEKCSILHQNFCAAKAIFYCPSMNSHRPRSQNTAKERTFIPEKDSTRKRPRSHVSLEKSSKNYKPLENRAKPNLLPDVTPQPANSFGKCIWRVCHVVKPELREFLAILSSQRNWPIFTAVTLCTFKVC